MSTCVSLFTGGGIGDLALRGAGVEVLVANELLADRAAVYKANYPETEMIVGSIVDRSDEVVEAARRLLAGRELDVLFATPPCQGMSKNGRGKLLSGIRAGLKPSFDPRNRLALEAVKVALALRPKIVLFENVPEMEYALIEDEQGQPVDLLEVISGLLAPEYRGAWEVVEFADYGVPQRRQRLITVFSRVEPFRSELVEGKGFLPVKTHSKEPTMFTRRWVSVAEALAGVPAIDAASEVRAAHPRIPFHRVPLLDEEKYFWVSNTPPGRGAFDNQCVNSSCLYQGNPTHGSKHDSEGVNRSNKDTPCRCVKCGELLPRPWVRNGAEYRLMSGFTSAYKRMVGSLPASALTRNLSYACSDQKLHPTENRVLSLHEAFILHTVDQYEFCWKRVDGKSVSDKTIREIIGESIPPKGLERIVSHVMNSAGLKPCVAVRLAS
jgi:DNA (cytosine-5)-methyltransferase 1